MLFFCSAKIAGIFTVMSYTICPSYLFIRSHMAMQDARLPTGTKYNTWFSSNKVAWLLITFATSLVCGVFYDAFVSFSAVSDEAVEDLPVFDDVF